MAIQTRQPYWTARTLALLLAGIGCGHSGSGPVRNPIANSLTPRAQFISGKLYFSQRVFDKAENQFRLAVQGDPSDAEYRGHWATALASLGDERLGQALTISDKDARLAAIRAAAGLFISAAEQFTNAIRMDPGKPCDWSDNRAHFWANVHKQAEALFGDGQFAEALEVFRILTLLNPGEPEGFFRVAYTMDRLGETKQAVILAGEARDMAELRIRELGDCGENKGTEAREE